MRKALSVKAAPDPQLLHLVFGGELTDLDAMHFADLGSLDLVGVFPNYKTAYDAWKAKAQATVDNARMRYFIVHLHRLLTPEIALQPKGKGAQMTASPGKR
jgi:hypothetical protein